MRRVAIAAAIAIGCGSAPERDRLAERAACELISPSGAELARCLVMKHDWPAESAGPAKYAWQRTLDSLRQEHEAQVAVVLAAQARVRDSLVAAHSRAFRSCVLRFVEAYHRGTADVAHERMNESYLEATTRTCGARFPAANFAAVLSPDFLDTLIVVGTIQRAP